MKQDCPDLEGFLLDLNAKAMSGFFERISIMNRSNMQYLFNALGFLLFYYSTILKLSNNQNRNHFDRWVIDLIRISIIITLIYET